VYFNTFITFLYISGLQFYNKAQNVQIKYSGKNLTWLITAQ